MSKLFSYNVSMLSKSYFSTVFSERLRPHSAGNDKSDDSDNGMCKGCFITVKPCLSKLCLIANLVQYITCNRS